MKIAAHVLSYNVNRFLKAVLENIEPHVDKIYIAYADRPFGYIKKSRDTKINPTQLSDVHAAMSSPKIEIIQGDWETEDACRNACLQRARDDGFDWFLTQDADEFYTESCWRQLKRLLLTNKTDNHITTTWYNFWKSSHYVIVDKNGSIKDKNAGFAIRCQSDVKFDDRRASRTVTRIVDCPCYHYSYVMSDDEMREKLSTWSHSTEVFSTSWYNIKWLNWNEDSRYLNPVTPRLFDKAIRFPLEQPDFAEQFSLPVNFQKTGLTDATMEVLLNSKVHMLTTRRAIGRMVRSWR